MAWTVDSDSLSGFLLLPLALEPVLEVSQGSSMLPFALPRVCLVFMRFMSACVRSASAKQKHTRHRARPLEGSTCAAHEAKKAKGRNGVEIRSCLSLHLYFSGTNGKNKKQTESLNNVGTVCVSCQNVEKQSCDKLFRLERSAQNHTSKQPDHVCRVRAERLQRSAQRLRNPASTRLALWTSHLTLLEALHEVLGPPYLLIGLDQEPLPCLRKKKKKEGRAPTVPTKKRDDDGSICGKRGAETTPSSVHRKKKKKREMRAAPCP